MMLRTVILISLTVGALRVAIAQGKESFDGFKLVDKTGNIRKPVDYRDIYKCLVPGLCSIQRAIKFTSPTHRLELPSTTAAITGSPMALSW